MSISSTVFSSTRYIKNSNGVYQPYSEWTKASDVECDDGKTVESKIGAISGITSSVSSTSTSTALSASAGKGLADRITTIENQLSKVYMYSVGGTYVVSPSSTGYPMFDITTLRKAFAKRYGEISQYSSEHTDYIVLAANGDGDANSVHIDGVTFVPHTNSWHTTFPNAVGGGKVRVQWVAFYIGNANKYNGTLDGLV